MQTVQAREADVLFLQGSVSLGNRTLHTLQALGHVYGVGCQAEQNAGTMSSIYKASKSSRVGIINTDMWPQL